MERKIGLISMVIGVFWFASFIAALILGLTFIGGIEDTVLSPVDFIRGLDFTDLFEGPLMDLRNRIESVFTTIKLVYGGGTTWLALPQILLIYTGWRLRKLASKGVRRRRK